MVLSTAMLCLAINVYHEARSESLPGQYAVALVTMNRANNDRRKVCGEVTKPAQFSWTSEFVFERVLLPAGKPKETQAWKQALKVSRDVLAGRVTDFTGGATYYHATSVRPKWRKSFTRTMALGKHVFYRVA